MFAGSDTLLSVAKGGGGKPSHPLVHRATVLWRNRLHTKTQFKPKVGFGTMFPRYATDLFFQNMLCCCQKHDIMQRHMVLGFKSQRLEGIVHFVCGDSMTNDCGRRTNFRRKTINYCIQQNQLFYKHKTHKCYISKHV